MEFLIDGEPEWCRDFDGSIPDSSCYVLTTEPTWGGPPLTGQTLEDFKVTILETWREAEPRRQAASKLMSELRKSGHIKPKYTPERNAKIAAYHARRRLQKQGESK